MYLELLSLVYLGDRRQYHEYSARALQEKYTSLHQQYDAVVRDSNAEINRSPSIVPHQTSHCYPSPDIFLLLRLPPSFAVLSPAVLALWDQLPW